MAEGSSMAGEAVIVRQMVVGAAGSVAVTPSCQPMMQRDAARIT
jgi:hypothetical protein